MNRLEEGSELMLDYNKLPKVVEHCSGVIPVAVQNVDTKEVILLAYTNKKAIEESIKQRIAVFWSTSRNELWEKGKTSGNAFELLDIYVNCEQNSLLYLVRPKSDNMCHTKSHSGKPRNCFYRKINFETGKLENMNP